MSNNGITWKNLQEANTYRLPQFKNKHGGLAHSKPDGSDWSPAQWLQAIIGELGEYANVRKKYERGDLTQEEFDREAGYELADTIIYLSILAKQLNIDLDEAVKDKFNIVSERVDSNIFIGDDWRYYINSRRAISKQVSEILELAKAGIIRFEFHNVPIFELFHDEDYANGSCFRQRLIIKWSNLDDGIVCYHDNYNENDNDIIKSLIAWTTCIPFNTTPTNMPKELKNILKPLKEKQ